MQATNKMKYSPVRMDTRLQRLDEVIKSREWSVLQSDMGPYGPQRWGNANAHR